MRLGSHGWSDLDWWTSDKHHSCQITHIFDSPFQVIADALLSICSGANRAEFRLHDEPGQCIWSMQRMPDRKHLLSLEIRFYRENFEVSKPAYKKMELEVSQDFLVDSFISELEKISQQLKHPKFASDRTCEDFPWDDLKRLQKYKSRN